MNPEMITLESGASFTSDCARLINDELNRTLDHKPRCILGLTPDAHARPLMQDLADCTTAPSRLTLCATREYIGLPGETAQDRLMHPESSCFGLIGSFAGRTAAAPELLVPGGTIVDPERFAEELERNAGDWAPSPDAGAILINTYVNSPYLGWARHLVMDEYARDLEQRGGVDVQIIIARPDGSVACHLPGTEAEGMILSRLEGHPAPYAFTMSAPLIFQARHTFIIAQGPDLPLQTAINEPPSPHCPLSWWQSSPQTTTWLMDKTAAETLS